MMPSAKIVICDRFLPENMSYRPNIVFWACSTRTASASLLMPGTTMCPPTRYTARRPSVNSTRFLRSATAKMFFRLSSMATTLRDLRDHLDLAAGGGDRLGRFTAELVGVNGQGLRDLAAGEHLDFSGAADQPVLAQQLDRDLRAGVEALLERVEVHDLELHAEDVVETALRHAPVQRHLAAFEPALVMEAGTGLRALVSAAGLHALARALAAADPLLRMCRPLWGTEV